MMTFYERLSKLTGEKVGDQKDSSFFCYKCNKSVIKAREADISITEILHKIIKILLGNIPKNFDRRVRNLSMLGILPRPKANSTSLISRSGNGFLNQVKFQALIQVEKFSIDRK